MFRIQRDVAVTSGLYQHGISVLDDSVSAPVKVRLYHAVLLEVIRDVFRYYEAVDATINSRI